MCCRPARYHDDAEGLRLVTLEQDIHTMRTRGQLEVMIVAAEIADDAGVKTIDVHLRAPRLDVQLQPTRRDALERWRQRRSGRFWSESN